VQLWYLDGNIPRIYSKEGTPSQMLRKIKKVFMKKTIFTVLNDLFRGKVSVLFAHGSIVLLCFSAFASTGEESLYLSYSDWTLKGKGAKKSVDSGDVEFLVFASSKGYGYWLSPALAFLPGKTYQLSFQALAAQNGGSPEVGLTSYNKDLGWWAAREWTDYTILFTAPARILPERSSLRFGQYGMRGGQIHYRGIRVSKVTPEYKKCGPLLLGTGEIVYDNRYQFITGFLVQGNSSRPLKSFQCAFNSNRWVFIFEIRPFFHQFREGIFVNYFFSCGIY